MNERLTDEGIEHLQAAARELISAARIFLDVVEDLVDEPERITQSLSGVVETFRDMTARPVQPWERHAWGHAARSEHSGDPGDDPLAGAGTDNRPETGRARSSRGGSRCDEPTLFPTGSDQIGIDDLGVIRDLSDEAQDLVGHSTDVGSGGESDWAVWEDDEVDSPNDSRVVSPVVDIREVERRPGARGATKSGGRNGSAKKRSATSATKGPAVKRITVD